MNNVDKEKDGTNAIEERTKVDNETASRFASVTAFIFALLVYAAICITILVTKLHYEKLAAIITAIALLISLSVRALLPNTSHQILKTLKLLGDWVAVTFTLSAVYESLEPFPISLIVFTVILAAIAAIAFLREK